MDDRDQGQGARENDRPLATRHSSTVTYPAPVCYNRRSCKSLRGGAKGLYRRPIALGSRRYVFVPVVFVLLSCASALAGCAEMTTLDSVTQVGRFKITIVLEPKTINPAQRGTINYSFLDTSNNKPVTQ